MVQLLKSAKQASQQAAQSLSATVREILRHRLIFTTMRSFLLHNGLTASAALAFYFLMSLFPFLIFLASALALLPIPDLPRRMVDLAWHFVPAESMPVVESMLNSTMRSNGKLISAGFVLTIISASNAFASTAESLNAIFERENTLSFWKGRIKGLAMTFAIGGLTTVALSAMLLGPNFAHELEQVFRISRTFVWVWPVVRYILAIGGALASLEMLYYLVPGRRQSFGEQLPGSIFAVLVWFASSALLGMYLRRFAYINAIYGTLASFIVLMIWLQITAAAILLGAELIIAVEKFRQETANEEARAAD